MVQFLESGLEHYNFLTNNGKCIGNLWLFLPYKIWWKNLQILRE